MAPILKQALNPVVKALTEDPKGGGPGKKKNKNKNKDYNSGNIKNPKAGKNHNNPKVMVQKVPQKPAVAPVSMEKQLEEIVRFGDPGILMPTTQVYTVDIQCLMEAIDCVISRLAMTTSIFCFPGGVHPSFVGMYLQMAFLVYIKMNGELTGSAAGTVPVNLNDWAIPLPFAKYLQGFGKFYEDGCSFRSSFNHDVALQISTTAWGATDGNITLYNDRTIYPLNNHIFDMVPVRITSEDNDNPTATMTEWMPTVSSIDPINEDNFTTSVLRVVSEAVSASGMAYVTGDKIPSVAPCASAYTQPSDPLISGKPVCFVGIADDFHPEIALMYTRYSPVIPPGYFTQANYPRAYSQKCLCQGMDSAENGAPPWFMQTLYNAVFILSTYEKYPPKTFMDLEWCQVPITTLYPVPVKMHFNGFSDLVNYHYRELMNLWNISLNTVVDSAGDITNDSYPDFNGDKWFSLIVMSYMTFLAHLYRHVPYHRPMMVYPSASSQYNPNDLQIMYASPSWLSTQLPPLIANAISDVGVVCYRGRIYYPDFYIFSDATPTATGEIKRGPLWSFYTGFLTRSTAVVNANYDFFQYNLYLQDGATGNPFSSTGELPFGLTNWQLGYTAGGRTPIFTINGFAETITSTLYQFMEQLSTNQALNKTLTHVHNDKCGSSAVMLSSLFGTPYLTDKTQSGTANLECYYLLNINEFPLLQTDAKYPVLYSLKRSVTTIGSLKQMSNDEMVRALIYFYTWDFTDIRVKPTTASSYTVEMDAKFALRVNPSVSSTKMLEDVIRQTFAANSAFGDALSKKMAKYKRNVAHGIIDIPKKVEDTHCFIGKLFDDVLGGLGDSLRLGVGQVAGMVCKTGAAALGVPELSPLAGTGCSKAADLLYGAITSSLGISANDTSASKRTGKTASARPLKNAQVAVNELHQSVKKRQGKRRGPYKPYGKMSHINRRRY